MQDYFNREKRKNAQPVQLPEAPAFVKFNQAEIRKEERMALYGNIALLCTMLAIFFIALWGAEHIYEKDTGAKLPPIKWDESLFQHAPRPAIPLAQ